MTPLTGNPSGGNKHLADRGGRNKKARETMEPSSCLLVGVVTVYTE